MPNKTNQEVKWEENLNKYFIKGGGNVNEAWFEGALRDFIRQTIKEEREEAVREVMNDFEKALRNKTQAMFINLEDFHYIKNKYLN